MGDVSLDERTVYNKFHQLSQYVQDALSKEDYNTLWSLAVEYRTIIDRLTETFNSTRLLRNPLVKWISLAKATSLINLGYLLLLGNLSFEAEKHLLEAIHCLYSHQKSTLFILNSGVEQDLHDNFDSSTSAFTIRHQLSSIVKYIIDSIRPVKNEETMSENPIDISKKVFLSLTELDRFFQLKLLVQALCLLCVIWLRDFQLEKAKEILSTLVNCCPSRVYLILNDNENYEDDDSSNHDEIDNNQSYWKFSIELAYYLLAASQYLLEENDPESESESLRSTNCCLSICARFWPAIFLKGQICAKRKKYQESLQLFRQCSKHYHTTEALNAIGCMDTLLGNRWLTSYSFLEAIAAHNPEENLELEPIYNLYKQYEQCGEPEEEQKMLEYLLQAQQQWKENLRTETSNALDRQSVTKRKIHKVLLTFKINTKTSSRQDFFPLSFGPLSLSHLDIVYLMAKSSIAGQNLARAISYYKFILSSLAKDKVQFLRIEIIVLYREYCLLLLQTSSFQEALLVCDHVLSCCSWDPVMLIYKAEVFFNLRKNFREAIVCLNRVLLLIETIEGSLVGKISSSSNERSDKATERIPLVPSVHFEGKAIFRNESNQNMFDSFETRKLLKARAYNDLTLCFLCLRQYEIAMEMATRALALSRDQLQTVFNYCLLLIKFEKILEACHLWFEVRAIPLETTISVYEDFIKQRQTSQSRSRSDKQAIGMNNAVISEQQMNDLDLVLIFYWREYMIKKQNLKQQYNPDRNPQFL